jgi:putative membrane protein
MLTALWFLLLLQGSTLDQAMEIKAAELKFSRVAENRAHLDRVRDFARMLGRDQAQSSIEGARQKPGADITASVPLSKEHEKKVDQLIRLSGEEFDRTFIDAIIKEHKQAIRLLESLTDEYGIQQAQALLPDLQKHLREAQAIRAYLRSPASYVRDR